MADAYDLGVVGARSRGNPSHDPMEIVESVTISPETLSEHSGPMGYGVISPHADIGRGRVGIPIDDHVRNQHIHLYLQIGPPPARSNDDIPSPMSFSQEETEEDNSVSIGVDSTSLSVAFAFEIDAVSVDVNSPQFSDSNSPTGYSGAVGISGPGSAGGIAGAALGFGGPNASPNSAGMGSYGGFGGDGSASGGGYGGGVGTSYSGGAGFGGGGGYGGEAP